MITVCHADRVAAMIGCVPVPYGISTQVISAETVTEVFGLAPIHHFEAISVVAEFAVTIAGNEIEIEISGGAFGSVSTECSTNDNPPREVSPRFKV